MTSEPLSDREGRFCDALSPTQREAFWDRVDRSAGRDECWPWMGSTVGDGYGQYGSGHFRAHRIAFVLSFGRIPDGLFACHACDRRRCCNPGHLWLGTNRENLRDMVKKGRHAEQMVTHCPQGHEYTPENTWINNRGWRHCRECKRAHLKRFHEAKKAERAESSAA